eukprot:COSAG01_NODE_4184_length_5261_cov_27.557342_1_plen_458_part_00
MSLTGRMAYEWAAAARFVRTAAVQPQPQVAAPQDEPELEMELGSQRVDPEPELEPEPEPEPEPQQRGERQAALGLPKERGGRFFLATDGEAVNDSLLFTIGLFRLPTAGFYGGTFPTAEMLAIVKGSSASLPGLWLPPEVRGALPNGGGAFDFFFMLSDVGSIVAKHGLSLNLIHHAWLFPQAAPGKRTMGDVDLGIFAYPGGQVGPADKRGLGFQCLSRTRVSIHPQSAKNPDAGMCCSPNNARFNVQPAGAEKDAGAAAAGAVPGLSYFWSVAVAPKKGREAKASKESAQLDGRACVSLQLLLTEPEAGGGLRQALNDAVEGCETLEPLLGRLSDVLGAGAAAATAARLTFGLETAPWPGTVGPAQKGHVASSAELSELNRGGGGRGRGAGRGAGGRGSGGAAKLACASCKASLAASAFSKAQRGKGESRRCKQCVAAEGRATKPPSARAAKMPD